jgi:hypothetical protein
LRRQKLVQQADSGHYDARSLGKCQSRSSEARSHANGG